jgi:hypothetical protein
MVNAVYFCASKFEVFGDRGKNDYLGSRDLEDVVAVVDGRQELVGEIKAAQGDVRSYLGKEIAKLLGVREFLEAKESRSSLAGLPPLPRILQELRVAAILQRRGCPSSDRGECRTQPRI